MLTPKHELKCWPEPYVAVVTGWKRHEIRRADRFFEVGDLVLLREYRPAQWNREAEYTGRKQLVRVTYISRGPSWGLPDGLVVLSIHLLELGVSAIVDLYELKAHERIRFVRLFLEALVDAPKKLWHPALVVLDEAHVFCPQQGEAESAGAVIDLCTRGRKRGYGAVLATQRLSKLHKDAAAELNNKLIGRTGLDVDVKRAADELGFGKERWREMRELEPGEFFVFGPAFTREVTKTRIGPIETTHPKAGARLASLPPAPTDRIKALLPKLSDLPAEQERKAKSEADLRHEVRSLKAQLAAAERSVPVAPAPKLKEVPVFREGHISRLEALGDRCIKAAEAFRAAAADLAEARRDHIRRRETFDAQAVATSRAMNPSNHAPRLVPRPVPRHLEGKGEALPRAQQRILDAIAWLNAVGVERPDKTQVALFADLTPDAGHTVSMFGALRTAGLIDYPAPGIATLTSDGAARADTSNAPQSAEDMQRQVLAKLPSAQRRILEVLIQSHPAVRPKSEVAEAAGLVVDAGHTVSMFGRLRSLGLIDYPQPGQVVARPVLFLEAGAR